MKAARSPSFVLALYTCVALSDPCHAAALDGGRASADGDAGARGSSGEQSPRADAAASAVPLACGGALCRTTTGSTCSITLGTRRPDASGLALMMIALFFYRARRRAGLRLRLSVVALGASQVALAAAPVSSPPATESVGEPPVDVVIRDAPPPRRIVSVEWNPVSLVTIGKLSANVIVAPVDHHALIVSPFYAWADTAPVYTFDVAGNATQLPEQKFRGFGAELGYRYYFGKGGPRGLFLGPSLIVGSFTATPMSGLATHYADVGFAGDAGYEILLADRFALSLGAGLEATWTSRSIPAQQFPARIYANDGVRPRILLSLGWAF